MRQITAIGQALRGALLLRGWRFAELDENDGGSCASPSDGYRGTDVRFVVEGEGEGETITNDSGANTVYVINDAEAYAAGAFLQFEDLYAVRDAKSPKRIRLGRDILFPFLNGRAGTLEDYAALVAKDYLDDSVKASANGGSLITVLEQLNCVDGPVPVRVPVHPADYIRQILSAADTGKTALICIDALADRCNFFYQALFRRHLSALTDGTTATTKIPLFVSAIDIRNQGLTDTLWNAARKATGIALSRELVEVLTTCGFFHTYVYDIGVLRTDYDLDPNTRYLADIFALAGSTGSFTLGCEPELVFQGPVFDRKAKAVPFKTLGTRFYYNTARLALYDGGQIVNDQVRNELAKGLVRLKREASRIVHISSGCLSAREAGNCLIELALVDHRTYGAGFPEAEVDRVLSDILSGDRLRPANRRNAVAATLSSGLFRQLPGGLLSIRSRQFASWLVSDAIYKGLTALCRQSDVTLLDQVFATANLPLHAMQWAVERDGDTFVEEIRNALPAYMQSHRFKDGAPQASSELVENLWFLILTVAESLHSRDIGDGARIVADLCGDNLKMLNLSLPQSYFSKLKLRGWTFENCNLRNVRFAKCALEGARFQASLLSGATFDSCDVGSYDYDTALKTFNNSDLSGAEFVGCPNFADLFETDQLGNLLNRSSWTAANIELDSEDAGIEAVFRKIRHHAITAPGLRVAQPSSGNKGLDHKAPWPASAKRSFTQAQWDERPLTLRTPQLPHGQLIPRQGLCGALAAAFAVENSPPPDVTWHCVADLTAAGVVQAFAGAATNGAVWLAVVRNNACRWTKIDGLPPAKDLVVLQLEEAAFGGQAGDIALALRTIERDNTITLVLVRDGAAKPISIQTLEFPGPIECLAWIRPLHAVAVPPELMIGLNGAGGYVVFHKSGAWQAQPFRGDFNAVTVSVVGYCPRENVAIACCSGGQVIGYRNIEPGWLEPLYRFHTAHERYADVALLNRQGQILIVGLTADEIAEGKKPGQRNVLWALVQPSGNVVTVVSLKPEADEFKFPVLLDPETDDGDQQQDVAQNARLDGIVTTLQALQQKNDTIGVRPILTKMVTFSLMLSPNAKRASDNDGLYLPKSIDDAFGDRYRMIDLVVRGVVNRTPAGSRDTQIRFKRRYTERQMLPVTQSNTELHIACAIPFQEGVSAAEAELRIAYPSPNKDRDITRTWKFHLNIEWEDNPFVSDGAFVSGTQFFGLKRELDEAADILKENRHLIVWSCRRAGKSSFLNVVAQRLRESKPSHVTAIVTGDKIAVAKDIIPAVQDSLRWIGLREQRTDYIELANLRLSETDIASSLLQLKRNALARGFAAPFVVLVDEWGAIGPNSQQSSAGSALIADADKLKTEGVVLCLTSTPTDFAIASTANQSGWFRAFQDNLNVGQLRPEDIVELIRDPLEDRKIDIDEDVVRAVLFLSSNAPHDANILMHFALNNAKEEKKLLGSQGRIRITLKHLLPETNGDMTTEKEKFAPVQMLVEKYRQQQVFLIELVAQRHGLDVRNRVLAQAGDAPRPTADNLEITSPAAWDKEQFGIPRTGMVGEEWRAIFAEAGYQVPLQSGTTDIGLTPGPKTYKLWIPWGLAEYYRELRRIEQEKK